MLKLGDLSIERDWGWAPEYVEAMWAMLQREEPEDFVIATGRSCSLQTFVKNAFSSLDLDWERYVQQDQAMLRPSEISKSCGLPLKAAALLGWSARISAEQVAARMAQAEIRLLQGQSVEDLLC